jgi:hypothetical protein
VHNDLVVVSSFFLRAYHHVSDLCGILVGASSAIIVCFFPKHGNFIINESMNTKKSQDSAAATDLCHDHGVSLVSSLIPKLFTCAPTGTLQC